jgi:hypothetical protein
LTSSHATVTGAVPAIEQSTIGIITLEPPAPELTMPPPPTMSAPPRPLSLEELPPPAPPEPPTEVIGCMLPGSWFSPGSMFPGPPVEPSPHALKSS